MINSINVKPLCLRMIKPSFLSADILIVAKNDDFIAFAQDIARFALENKPADLEALKALSYNGKSIAETLIDKTAVIGEKIDISTYSSMNAEGVAAYNHANYRIGVLVGLTQGDDASLEAGKDVAMQIAAMNPIAVDESAVSDEVKNKELEIGREQAKAEGKPEQIWDKILPGKLERFVSDNTTLDQEQCLLDQKFIKDEKQTVAQYVESYGDVSITGFKRATVG